MFMIRLLLNRVSVLDSNFFFKGTQQHDGKFFLKKSKSRERISYRRIMLVLFKTYYESHFLGLILLNRPRVTFGLRLSYCRTSDPNATCLVISNSTVYLRGPEPQVLYSSCIKPQKIHKIMQCITVTLLRGLIIKSWYCQCIL